jgi:nitroreductase
MDFNKFKNMVLDTRCTRRFKPCEITKEELLELVDLARNASSAKNMQPLKYIVITDEKEKEEVYKPLMWAAHLKEWDQSEDEKPSAYILVINDTSIEGFAPIDSGIAMQTIMLGATAKGLSACMLASIDKETYRKFFNLADNLEPMFIMAFGKRDEEIKLVTPKEGDTNYYRDTNDTHCVPKRPLEEIVLND